MREEHEGIIKFFLWLFVGIIALAIIFGMIDGVLSFRNSSYTWIFFIVVVVGFYWWWIKRKKK